MNGRLQARSRVDLHMHSTLSDGALPPAALLKECAEARLNYVAITDHDMAPSLAVGWHDLAGHRIYLIHATELSAVYENHELHLLVYFPGEMPEGYRDFLRSRAIERAERYDRAVSNLKLSSLEFSDTAARSGERAITRTHLAHALVQAGHAANIGHAFRAWIGNHTGHVPKVTLGWEEAIERAREAGGRTSWAHPPLELAQLWAGRFAEMGLHALETRRPRLGRHGRARLERIAHRNGLAMTGGSDWHGLPGQNLGQFCMPGKEAMPFLRDLSLSL